MGDQALGIIMVANYDYNLDSPTNKAFVQAYNDAFHRNPDFFSVGGYDGMHLIDAALQKAAGKTDGDSLIAAAKGMAWDSPPRPNVDRSGNARRRPDRSHLQGRKSRRRAAQRRNRQGAERQGPRSYDEMIRRTAR
jgi:ABC-type branched-subunit amino acid transport system substrate-binding protein